MSNKQQLMGKLKEFTQNMRKINQLTKDAGVNDANRVEYNQLVNMNARIIQAIQVLFRQIYNSTNADFTMDKLKKEFNELITKYEKELKKYEEKEMEQIKQLRKTYVKLRQSIQNRNSVEQPSESERGVQIMMVEVNQQTLHYERMIEIKEKEIIQIKGRMVDALKVQQDMKNMVFEQGEMLDVAEANIDNANRNVHEGHEDLNQAVELHASSKKKKICIFVIVFVVLLAIIIPIIIKFA